jgi:hypothetical protein
MPYTYTSGPKKGQRNYTAELAWEKRNPGKKRQAKRIKRNKCRVLKGAKVGDGKHCDHKDGNALNNKRKNLRLVSAKTNLKKEAKSKKRKSRKT